MDKVVFRQTQFKKALEKQLGEIEVGQRQSEARRLKQIRDLGVDLARIQRTSSRELEYNNERSSSRGSQRRGSLPALDSSEVLSLHTNPSRPPQLERRYSCIGSVPVNTPDIREENSDNIRVLSPADLHFPNNSTNQPAPLIGRHVDKHVDSIPTASKHISSINNNGLTTNENSPKTNHSTERQVLNFDETDLSLMNERRVRLQPDENNRPNLNNDGHNVTTVFVYTDKQSTSKEALATTDDDSERRDSESMFQFMRNNRGRRNSEPAVGSCLIRRLQATELNDFQSLQQRNIVDGEVLRRSIEANLPSNIVAEKDEEEKEAENSQSEGATGVSADLKQKFELSSISENDQDIDQAPPSLSTNQNFASSSSKERNKNSKFNLNSRKVNSFPGYRGRRSSDGDVFSYSYAKKLNEMRNQVWRPQIGVSKSARNKENVRDMDSECNIWDSLKSCRYLRGSDVAEVNEPSDVTEYVFGKGTIEAVTTQK